MRPCRSCSTRIARRHGYCWECVYLPAVKTAIAVQAKKTRPMCRHCGTRYATRPLGLCWQHYALLSIRGQYGSVSKFAPRPEPVAARRLPEPTMALPGKEEKIEVLRQRYEAGENLWNPLDADYLF